MTPETIEAEFPGLTFVPVLVRDDFTDSKGHINRNGGNHWSVSLTRNGYTFTTEYHQGSGHRTWKRSINDPGQVNCRKGDRVVVPGRISLHLERILIAETEPTVPTLTDVLYCLAMDAAGTDYNDFEDWCAEYGYDDDSISAKDTYDACCRTYKALRKLGLGLERLQELFQDY